MHISDDTRGVSSLRDAHLGEQELARKYLTTIYVPLRRHYEWFRRTQRGHIKRYGRTPRSRTEGYRWRGRSETHVLTSGMDDYPRAPAHAGELHLDLISWVGFFSRTMKEIAEFIGEEDDAETFAENEKAIIHNLDGNPPRLNGIVPTFTPSLDRFALERGGPDVLRSRHRPRRSVVEHPVASLLTSMSRRVIPRMPPWLPFPLPSPPLSCRSIFPTPRSHAGLDGRPSALMVPIWCPQPFSVAS